MAYSQSWDETAPQGASTPSATLDTIIQALKISLRERLEQVIPDWDDDLVDPKTLGEGTARIIVDTAANKPAVPVAEGQVYLESDLNRLYYGVAGAWVFLGTTVTNARPGAPFSDHHVTMDPDTGIIGVDDGAGVWSDLNGVRAVYDVTAGAGNRVTVEQTIGAKRILYLQIQGDGGGALNAHTSTIDFDEFDGGYLVSNLLGMVIFPFGAGEGIAPIDASWGVRAATKASFANNTLSLFLYDWTSGGVAALNAYFLTGIFWFSA